MMDMKRVEWLEKNHNALKKSIIGGHLGDHEVDELFDYIKQQHTLIERYKEALEFYASRRNWIEPKTSIIMNDQGPDFHDGPPAIADDEGNKARQALEGGGG